MRIVLCYPVEAKHLAQIHRTLNDLAAAGAAPADCEVVDAGQERIAGEILAADIFCGHAKVPVPWEQVVRLGRLKWIQSSAAGMEHCLVPAVIDSSILVTSASGVLADQVAEHCLALLLGLMRGLPEFFRAQQRREFVRRPTRDLHAATVGIVGFGGVGRRIAELLVPFRARILATDYFPILKPPHVAELWPPERLDELLPLVDALIFAVPLTDSTRNMIDRRLLARLREGAVLVNVARGQLLVEEHLVEALACGRLAGAALDVTPEEPLPPTSPLWDAPRLVITPHVAGQSARRIDDMTDFFCDNLRRYFLRRPLRNLLEDKRLGFPPPDPDGWSGR